MRRNEPWLSPTSGSPYPRGSHFGRPRSVFPRVLKITVALVVVLVVLGVIQLVRPVPSAAVRSTLTSSIVPGAKPSLPWPSQGGGEVDINNVGAIGSFNPNSEYPLGSVAKMITALVVIKDHPLSLGASGPYITVTSSDVNTYNTMRSQNDAVIPVTLGEKLSEFQLLEALLIPSANNIAVVLANWDAGSTSAFVAKMNAYVKSLGMHHIVLNGPAGINPHTVGSAHDEILAAQALLHNSVLSEIVAMPQATLPGVGVTYNIDYNIGHNGFIGIETGTMGTAGNFVFAASGPSTLKGNIVGVVLGDQGAQPLIAALNEGTKLVDSARKVPTKITALQAGQVVAMISSPGNSPMSVESSQGVSFIGWPGIKVSYKAKFSKLPGKISKGTKVGTLLVSVGSQTKTVPLVTAQAVKGPSLSWRLLRL